MILVGNCNSWQVLWRVQFNRFKLYQHVLLLFPSKYIDSELQSTQYSECRCAHIGSCNTYVLLVGEFSNWNRCQLLTTLKTLWRVFGCECGSNFLLCWLRAMLLAYATTTVQTSLHCRGCMHWASRLRYHPFTRVVYFLNDSTTQFVSLVACIYVLLCTTWQGPGHLPYLMEGCS